MAYSRVFWAVSWAIAIQLAPCQQTPSWALETPNFEKLADAIHIAENGVSLNRGTEQYGIHTVHYKDEAEARAICIRTCKHSFHDHPGDWGALARKYCPVNWKVWKKNVLFYYNRRGK